MFLGVGELISYDNILVLSKICDGGGTRGQRPRSKVDLRINKIFQQIKVGNEMNRALGHLCAHIG